ncbi:hypothetical protein BCR42DRAFT_449451 [Absidia repens]|uniref:Uncharacterized protein n=1 Tax=Absidia repens TaxID=90262 RepID=A0A1X2IP17_9FUNG|nr:hypothetical protein BCR42DRAFT_449451 [Absidia repens]
MTYTKFRAADLWDVEGISPTLGRDHKGEAVVTVESCIYYLSLLEQFARMLTKFRDHLDAFHARAEKRYHLWVTANHRRENDLVVMVPPLDVAYMLHAHLLTPRRFVEDDERLDNKMMDYPMPLKELHIMRSHKNKPAAASINFWKYCCSTLDEPFTLELKDVDDSTELPQTCISCNIRLCMPWEDYGQWRTNINVVCKCWRCPRECSYHDRALQELIKDINVRGLAKSHDYAPIRGTMLDDNGKLKSVFRKTLASGANQQQRTSSTATNGLISRFKSLAPSSIHLIKISDPHHRMANSVHTKHVLSRKSMKEFTYIDKVTCSTNMDEIGTEFLNNFVSQEKDFLDDTFDTLIKKKDSTTTIRDMAYVFSQYYNHPSIFSVDLISQAKLVTLMNVTLVKRKWKLPDDLVLGIRQYKDYLCIMKNIPYCTGVSNPAINLAWQVHMMHPQNYRAFTTTYLGRLLEHHVVRPSPGAVEPTTRKYNPSSPKITLIDLSGNRILIKPSGERPPPPIPISENDYQHGKFNLADTSSMPDIHKKFGGKPDDFDTLPFVMNPSLLNKVHVYEVSKKIIVQTQAPLVAPPKDKEVSRYTVPESRTIHFGSSGGNYTNNYVAYSSYSSCTYSGCAGGGGGSSSCGGNDCSSGCGGGGGCGGC